MDLENIFRDVKLSKTEMTVLRFIQNDPQLCIREGIRTVAERCYSNPSSLVRLAKKLKFSGWLELVYFIKFNITMPKLDVTNDIDYMSIQPAEALTPLLAGLEQQRILIHGSGFSQLIAQYIYNKFLVTGVNASLALWPDYEILEQKNAARFDSIWIISKSGRSSSALNWVKALEGKDAASARPEACRDKARGPRSGDFGGQSPGVQRAAATGRPLCAPCATENILQKN